MSNRNDESFDETEIERIESEEADLESSHPSYEIVTYPADFTLEGLVSKYDKGTIKIPGFQRKFVWSINQASKLIESFLLGLPVPAIFLFTDPADNKQLVVDGQQRLLSIVYFFEGYFGSPTKGKRVVFSLKGLHEKSPYQGKTYEDLQDTDEAAFNRLNDSVLRAFVIKQLNPADDTSIYHIFERLNTGATQLVGQEIRNCIYHGPFNKLLMELNQNGKWRDVYGRLDEDKRQRDIELILRFFSLSYESSSYEKPMKDFLSEFMREHRFDDANTLDMHRRLFTRTIGSVASHLGQKPFHIRAGLNVAVLDSVMTVFAGNLDNIPQDIKARYASLIEDEGFLKLVSSSTTDKEVVADRLKKAQQKLFG